MCGAFAESGEAGIGKRHHHLAGAFEQLRVHAGEQVGGGIAVGFREIGLAQQGGGGADFQCRYGLVRQGCGASIEFRAP